MACHTPPLKKETREMPLPSLSPFPLKNVEFRDGIGLRLGNGISTCFFTFNLLSNARSVQYSDTVVYHATELHDKIQGNMKI